MSNGIVVEHKELPGTRFAVSEKNFNPDVHKKVRDLKPGETVLGYRPRSKDAQDTVLGNGSPAPTPGAAGEQETDPSDSQRDTSTGTQPAKTEGSASAGTKGQ